MISYINALYNISIKFKCFSNDSIVILFFDKFRNLLDDYIVNYRIKYLFYFLFVFFFAFEFLNLLVVFIEDLYTLAYLYSLLYFDFEGMAIAKLDCDTLIYFYVEQFRPEESRFENINSVKLDSNTLAFLYLEQFHPEHLEYSVAAIKDAIEDTISTMGLNLVICYIADLSVQIGNSLFVFSYIIDYLVYFINFFHYLVSIHSVLGCVVMYYFFLNIYPSSFIYLDTSKLTVARYTQIVWLIVFYVGTLFTYLLYLYEFVSLNNSFNIFIFILMLVYIIRINRFTIFKTIYDLNPLIGYLNREGSNLYNTNFKAAILEIYDLVCGLIIIYCFGLLYFPEYMTLPIFIVFVISQLLLIEDEESRRMGDDSVYTEDFYECYQMIAAILDVIALFSVIFLIKILSIVLLFSL